MHVLIAPASFKGSLSPSDAARAIDRGLRDAAARLHVPLTTDLCPIADGGEHTAAILAETTNAEPRSDSVTGPLDDTPIQARWFRIDALAAAPRLAAALDLPNDARPAAIFDSAEIVGLDLVPDARRDPTHVSTRGIGDLIARAHDDGCSTVVVGLGGTVSVDGAIGAASAHGWSFHAQENARVTPLGANLCDIAQIRPRASTDSGPRRRPARARPTVLALADVTSPLTGPTGAARTFAAQKGATPAQVETLEQGLEHLAARARNAGLSADPNAPGAGAAGGLGFGLAAFFGARLLPGATTVLRALDAGSRLCPADLVVTGEGSLDAQTTRGKAIAALADAARRAGVPVAAIAGRAHLDAARGLALAHVRTLVSDSIPPERARDEAPALLARHAGELLESLVRA